MLKILIIEDDADIASNIGEYFEDRGHKLDFAYNGNHGLNLARRSRFDLVILDLMLPGKDGIRVARELGEGGAHNAPILMLTARDTLEDRITGFEAGADDYLVKPFSLRELELRVNALVRRGQHRQSSSLLRVGSLELDRDKLSVRRENQPINLKPKAISILEYLMRHSNRVIPRQELIDHIWPDDPPEGDPLRVHIHSLRKKIDKPFDKSLIHTIHGVGYRIGDDPS